MSQSIRSDRISESTIARIAGNILSGLKAPDMSTPSQRQYAAQLAVTMARAIAAEVERTAPKDPMTPQDSTEVS